MGNDEEAAQLGEIAAECETQVKTNPNWRDEKWLHDRMNDAIYLLRMWQKAKEIPVKKDPLGENKLGDIIEDTILGWIGL
jgi:hypothetical protein